ncbi:hypothetical protein KFE25_014376 [Diacronema lutheri]|uniref:Right handed beta helix domain-containing protein n=2 Tax=Diacronema lutheri TaxID=2081491 RepID=A0A8J5X5E7_DIALT|nr:hypothetical protein KFE25_014376 [Diacronema lutheri]
MRCAVAALIGLAVGASAKTYSPKTSAELEAALIIIKSGDSVRLQESTYVLTKALNLTNRYQIKFEGGRGFSTIDGGGSTRMLQLVQAQEVTFKNVIFKNGYVDSSSTFGTSGGALYLSHCANVMFDSCNFIANSATGSGGALSIHDSQDISISASSFTGNRAGGNGGAVASFDSDSVTVSDSLFVGNAGMFGGALAASGGEDNVVSGTRFNANQAKSDGGGIYLSGVDNFEVALSNTFEGNTLESRTLALPVYISSGSVKYSFPKDNFAVSAQCGGGLTASSTLGTEGDATYHPRTVTIYDASVSGLDPSIDVSTVSLKVHGGDGSGMVGEPPLVVPANNKMEMTIEVLADTGGHRLTSIGKADVSYAGSGPTGRGIYQLDTKHATIELTVNWSIEWAEEAHAARAARAAHTHAGELKAVLNGLAAGSEPPRRAGFALGVVTGAAVAAAVAAVAALVQTRRGGAPLQMA